MITIVTVVTLRSSMPMMISLVLQLQSLYLPPLRSQVLLLVQPRLVQPQLVQPQLVQPQLVQPQLVQPQLVQPQLVQPRLVQPQQVLLLHPL